MAIIYFGAQVPVGSAENGNWNDVSQWYSNPGSNEGKDNVPGTLLGRLPLLTDQIRLCQFVTSGVVARVLTLTGASTGIWTGQVGADFFSSINLIAGVNDPAATWATPYVGYDIYFNVRSGTVNFNLTNSYEISGGTINGNIFGYSNIYGGTFNGTVSGRVNLYGNPTFNGNLTNIQELNLYTGATFTKTITSWSSGIIIMYGGTYNSASTPTASLVGFIMYAGTMARNIFTSVYTNLQVVQIFGGTLSFTGDIQVGAPGRAGTLNINGSLSTEYGPQFTGTDKNITAYGSPSSTYITFGSFSSAIDAGTYTGIITLLPSTGTNPPQRTIYGGTYTPPVQTLPLINVAYSTGKGVNLSTAYQNPGFTTYTQRVAISGSSDILQSELA